MKKEAIEEILDDDGSLFYVYKHKILYGFKAGDIILNENPEAKWNGKTCVIIGAGLGDNKNRTYYSLENENRGSFRSVDGEANHILLERPELKHKVGDKITLDEGEAEVLVIDPHTNNYFLGGQAFEIESESAVPVEIKKKSWWPAKLKDQSVKGKWFTEAEIEKEANGYLKKSEVLLSAISVPGIPDAIEAKMPAWVSEMTLKFKAGSAHLFMLWGNINDLQKNLRGDYLSLYQYLFEIFEQRDMVMFYSLSSGLQFASGEMENSFRNRYLSVPVGSACGGSATAKAATGLKMNQTANAPITQLIGETPDKALKFLERVLVDKSENHPRSALIIDFAHNVAPNNFSGHNASDRMAAEILERWAKDARIREAGNIVILVTPLLANLAEGLRSPAGEAVAIRVPKPDEEERIDYWDFCLKKNGAKVEDGLTASVLGRLTSGVGRKQISDIYSLAKTEGTPLNFAYIKKEKKRILQQEFGDKIKFEEPRCGFSGFGGEDKIKEILTDIQSYIIKGILRRVPMGMLFIGPPGTGKTELLRCWAWECGMNFVSHKNPRGMFVGTSENEMLQFLSSVDDASPILVVEDEADQSEAPRDAPNGDSGVSSRLRQMKFDFCSDEKRRGKVIWVRISNRPDLLDSAYLRDGRTDYTFAMLPPYDDVAKLKDIFAVMPGRENIPMAFSDYTELARQAAEKIYITGASIRKIMMVADIASGKEGLEKVEERHVREAIEKWSIAPKLAREIDRQTIIAIESSDIRPEGYERIFEAANRRLYGGEAEPHETSVFPGLDLKKVKA